MKKMKRLIPVLFLLFLSPLVYADDFQDGLDAANRGDFKTAIEKLKPLAEQGEAIAQSSLAAMYFEGLGITQDYVQAYMWLNISGANRNEETRKLRDAIEEQLTPTQIAEAQKLAREWMERHK